MAGGLPMTSALTFGVFLALFLPAFVEANERLRLAMVHPLAAFEIDWNVPSTSLHNWRRLLGEM